MDLSLLIASPLKLKVLDRKDCRDGVGFVNFNAATV